MVGRLKSLTGLGAFDCVLLGAPDGRRRGPPLAGELPGQFSVQLVDPVTPAMRGQSGMPGKVERATPLLNKLERGEVFLPRYNNQWLADLEAEWLAWSGLDDETSDQIDAAAYAATHIPNASAAWGGMFKVDLPYRWTGGRRLGWSSPRTLRW